MALEIFLFSGRIRTNRKLSINDFQLYSNDVPGSGDVGNSYAIKICAKK
jgi:hypothetical protein